MKKFLITLALSILFLPSISFAQTTLLQGGTGWSTSIPGELIVGTSSTFRYSRLPIGSNGSCLTVVSGLPSWGSCGTGGGSNYWSFLVNNLFPSTTTSFITADHFNASNTNATSTFQGDIAIPAKKWVNAFANQYVLTTDLNGVITNNPDIYTNHGFTMPGIHINSLYADGGLMTGSITAAGADLSLFSDSNIVANNPLRIISTLLDGSVSAGTLGQILQTTGSGVRWVSTSTLGINGGSGNAAWTIGNGLIYNATSSDKVGIGSTTPGSKLSVHTNLGGASTTPIFSIASSTSAGLATTTLFTVLGNANTGIGTSNPKSKLDVNGGVSIGTYAGVNAAPTNGLNVSGNVGIGVAVPGYALDVQRAVPFSVNAFNTSNSNGLRLDIDSFAAGESGLFDDASDAELASYIASTDTYGYANTIHVTSGNVGIDTTLHDAPLHVMGNGVINGLGNITDDGGGDIVGSGTNFVETFSIGDYITIPNTGDFTRITGITDETHMTVDPPTTAAGDTYTYTRGFRADDGEGQPLIKTTDQSTTFYSPSNHPVEIDKCGQAPVPNSDSNAAFKIEVGIGCAGNEWTNLPTAAEGSGQSWTLGITEDGNYKSGFSYLNNDGVLAMQTNIANPFSTTGLFVNPTSAIGIETRAPNATLFVKGIASSTFDIFTVASSTETQYITVKPTGNVGISSTTPSAQLSVNTNITNASNTPAFAVASSTTHLIDIKGNGAVGFNNQFGSIGQLLQSNGSNAAPTWIATSSALANLPLVTTYNGMATAGNGLIAIATTTNFIGLTAAKTTINTFTAGNATTSIAIIGYVKIRAIATDVAQFQISYIDENGAAQTYTGSSLSTTGNNPFAVGMLRIAPNSVASTSVALTTSIGSITYDTGATVSLISTN